MILRYLVMAGNTPYARMCRQIIFYRIDIEVRPLINDGLFTVAGQTIVRRRIRRRRHEHGQERCCK